LNFRDKFSKNHPLSNFMEVHPVGAELRRTDRHDEANTRFAECCRGA